MKTIYMAIFVVLIGMSGYAQPMLGKKKAEVISTIKANRDYTDFKEELTNDGKTSLHVTNEVGDAVSWILENGSVIQYVVIIDPSIVNKIVSQYNSKFTRDEDYQWSDYATGTRIYYHIIKTGPYFAIVVTFKDLTE